MKKVILVLGTIILSMNLLSQTSDIDITVKGFKELKGDLKIGLFKDEESFKKKLNPVDSLILKISSDSESCKLSNINHAEYAIAVYHDENEDGILNKKQLGIPLEGVGFSNIEIFKKKPPRFTDASFFLSSDTSLVISLFYNKGKRN